jgi:hypothetical protein
MARATSHVRAERGPSATARAGAQLASVGALVLAFLWLLAAEAHAGCCRVRRVDAQTPAGTVRVCEPDANGGCGTVLFAGTLAVGDSQTVCVPGQTVVYQEYDATTAGYGAAVSAVCAGGDVEL